MGQWAMPCRDYRIFFFLEGRHIKRTAKENFCADDEAATEEARQLLLDGSDYSPFSPAGRAYARCGL
jgi:hypothetical protein